MIHLENVSRTYAMKSGLVYALKRITLTVDHGEFIAVMGPSGSGKSTLMNIVGCLDQPTSGRYSLENVDVSKLNDNDLAAIRNRKIGFVFQNFNLLPRMSILKNVELALLYAGFPRGARREAAARAALESVGLAQRVSHRPWELSGGQQQRAAIARALATDPALLLADEPTGSLDSVTGNEIMKIFCELNKKGKTIVLVTHEHGMTRYVHRIVRLKDGTIDTKGRF
ncbi:MAG: ABC transporter ATP-binding protein [bacterium]